MAKKIKRAVTVKPAISVSFKGEKREFDHTLKQIAAEAKFARTEDCFTVDFLRSTMLGWNAVIVITQGCVEDFFALFCQQPLFTSVAPAHAT